VELERLWRRLQRLATDNSLYLWQQPFYQLKDTIPVEWLMPAVAVCGLLSFYAVEKPMRTYLNARISYSATKG
jgi:hypothetical protein